MSSVNIPLCALSELSSGELRLYAYMKHYCGDSLYFEFSKKVWKSNGYKIYTNQNQFYKDRDALIKKGYIEHIKDGKGYCSTYRILK